LQELRPILPECCQKNFVCPVAPSAIGFVTTHSSGRTESNASRTMSQARDAVETVLNLSSATTIFTGAIIKTGTLAAKPVNQPGERASPGCACKQDSPGDGFREGDCGTQNSSPALLRLGSSKKPPSIRIVDNWHLAITSKPRAPHSAIGRTGGAETPLHVRNARADISLIPNGCRFCVSLR